jgi:hypothetical protein
VLNRCFGLGSEERGNKSCSRCEPQGATGNMGNRGPSHRLFRAMTSPVTLDESQCWKVSGIRTAEAFFRAVPLLVLSRPRSLGAMVDAFSDPLLVSKSIARADVGAIRVGVGGALSDVTG